VLSLPSHGRAVSVVGSGVKSVFEISMLVSKFSCFVLLTMQRYGVIC